MSFAPEFVKLYAEERELYDCSGDSAFAQHQIERLMGEPRSMTYIEATLVGTALANPWEPALAPLYRSIAPTDLTHWDLRKIWEACDQVSRTPARHLESLEASELSLAIAVHWMWANAGMPSAALPSPARTAISLSGQFMSASGVAAIGRHYLTSRAEKKLAGEIQEIAAGLRDGNYSAAQCLERFVLLHERVSVHGH